MGRQRGRFGRLLKKSRQIFWWSDSGCADGGEREWMVLRGMQEKETLNLGPGCKTHEQWDYIQTSVCKHL